ncbi:putative carboxypeptidase C [Helianthus annuus]|nr:putative carboxypeptidase C [Helianthus annuus]
MNKITFSICITFTFLFFSAHSAPENAAISQIPGFDGTLPSKHYAGYVTIDENHGKKLYYYYVLSERNPSEDPVVLWLNGGPGCSSFDGFVYEHGILYFTFVYRFISVIYLFYINALKFVCYLISTK